MDASAPPAVLIILLWCSQRRSILSVRTRYGGGSRPQRFGNRFSSLQRVPAAGDWSNSRRSGHRREFGNGSGPSDWCSESVTLDGGTPRGIGAQQYYTISIERSHCNGGLPLHVHCVFVPAGYPLFPVIDSILCAPSALCSHFNF